MTAIGVERPRRTAHFLRNLLEMTGAMLVGMLVGGAAFAAVLAPLGMTLGEARLRYPAPWLLVMAVNMSVPMVAWMRHRGHSWRSSLEMAPSSWELSLPPWLRRRPRWSRTCGWTAPRSGV